MMTGQAKTVQQINGNCLHWYTLQIRHGVAFWATLILCNVSIMAERPVSAGIWGVVSFLCFIFSIQASRGAKKSRELLDKALEL